MKRWIIAIMLALVICVIGFGLTWSTEPAGVEVRMIHSSVLRNAALSIFTVVVIQYKGHEYLCAGGGIIEVKP